MTHYDSIILGAGALGSAAAYHLAKSGQKVLLLEQFELNHQLGSSYGLSRIIRYAYDYTQYIDLAKAVFPMWAMIEEEAGEKLYTRTGGLDFGRHDQESLTAVIACLRQTDIPHEILSPSEAQLRFPQFRFDDDMTILYQADTGILAASQCVLAQLRLAERHGATVQPDTAITRIIPHPSSVEVQTAQGNYTAGTLVIAAGSWMRPLLKTLGLDLPLYPEKCQEMYFDTSNPPAYEPERFPAFIAHMKYRFPYQPYGIASREGSGVKVAAHGGKRLNDISEVDYVPEQNAIELAQTFSQTYLPEVGQLRSSRVCLYTMTPDEHWVIDKHPEFPQIVFAGGCSGHAFKFAIIIGEILKDLALSGTTQRDISLFQAARFNG